MLSLNVGCGTEPTGTVNCDLYRNDVGHRLDGSTIKYARNFVVCDAQYLPFKSKAFPKVECNQVIEHVKNPYLLLKEIQRVCSGDAIIRCPHRLGDHRNRWHKHKFSRKWFTQNVKVRKSKVYKWRSLPNEYLPLIRVPEEMEIVISC